MCLCCTSPKKSIKPSEKNIDTVEKDIKPLIQMNTEKGFVFGNNKFGRYFILFFPGEELQLDVADGNLVFIIDQHVIQLLIIDLDKDVTIKHDAEEILKDHALNEIKYI